MDLLLWYLTHHNPRGVPTKWGFNQGDECPRCASRCNDQSETVDVGVGHVPVTYDMYCLVCGLEGHNSGTDVVWLEWGEDGEPLEFKEPKYILMMDEKYFGYDYDPSYPETLFDDKQEAYVFKGQETIRHLLTWFPHKSFEIIQVA